jgi:hypothetical protein
MTKIYNGTQHEINFFQEHQCDTTDPRKLIVLDGEQPFHTIPGGTNLNCVRTNKTAPTIDVPFTVKGAVEFTHYDPLPEGYDIYIVSNLYRSAVKELGGDTSKLATVCDTVYSKNDGQIRPCGVLSLAIG